MPGNVVDTPATERADTTSLSNAGNLDFSMYQPFASPSKNPAEDLRNQMRGMRGGAQPLKTPRMRNPLVDRRNPNAVANPEFTPLLKSATRNRLVHESILADKENSANGGIPDTPAAFRSSYASQGSRLPIDSSMLDGEHTSISADAKDATPIAPVASSSMLSSTPMPELPKRGEGGVLDQGNILTLRDQEAKLDQIQKDNFGLKLKIHFLEEALRKTGSSFQQATLKENVELKTEKMTIEADLKKQRKRLQNAEHELEEYRMKYAEYVEQVKKRHRTERDNEELERLQKLAEESQKVADEREQELEELRKRAEEAELAQPEADQEELQALKDDILDLEREARDRESQLDAKDEQLGSLHEQLKAAKSETENANHLQQDIEELEAELKEKDEELDGKDAQIAELKDCMNSAYDREKSTKKLRGDVAELGNQLRDKDQTLDEQSERLHSLEKRLQSAEAANAAELRQRDDDIRNAQRELADKDGEIRALQERLQTARGSWDAEAQQTDARIQEKDRLIQDMKYGLREKSGIIEQRDDELADLQKRLRTAESGQDEAQRRQNQHLKEQGEQIRELQEKLRVVNASSQAKLNEKDGLVQARESEMQTLQNRINALQSGDNAELRLKTEQLHDMEAEIKQKETVMSDQAQQIISLKARLGAMETPSKKDGLIKQQGEEVRKLKQQLQKLEQAKEVELDEMEQQLQACETQNAELQQKVQSLQDLEQEVQALEGENAELLRKVKRLQERAKAADKDQSVLGHQGEDLKVKQDQIEALEDELDQLRIRLEQAMQQRQKDVQNLERDLEVARSVKDGQPAEIKRAVDALKARLEAEHTEAKEALSDEILVLEASLDEAQAEKAALGSRVRELEQDVQTAWMAKDNGTPARERNELRLRLTAADNERETLKASNRDLEAELDAALQSKLSGTPVRERNELRVKLREAESKTARLQDRIETLEQDLEYAQQEKTIAEERKDLHDSLKQSKIEAEDLQIQLAERDRRLASSNKKEGELRGKVQAAQSDLADLQAQVAELETRLQSSTSKEKDLRAQLRELKQAKIQLEELETQLGERKDSSSGHARREAELRAMLREAKIELESVQAEALEKETSFQAAIKKEQELRERVRKARTDDTLHVQQQDLQAQLDDADLELRALQRQLEERERRLQTSLKREEKLRQKLKSMQQACDNDRTLDQKAWTTQLEASQKKHESELRGLAKQIQYLRAKCTREETFRSDLVFVKKWFLMQVKMYNQCNKADLRLLEEMGITPDISFREKKHSLRTVGLAVVASVRMRKMQQDWAGSKKLHESLLRKLEGMRRKQSKTIT